MPRRDIYHDIVVAALIADGWTITDDPLYLAYGGRDMYADLGAERPLGAEKAGQKIAVEIKSFVSASAVHDLAVAVGQYNLYRDLLAVTEPTRELYLAIPERTEQGIFSEQFGQLVLSRQQLQLLVFDEIRRRVVKWIP
jgi:hypothetical protein